MTLSEIILLHIKAQGPVTFQSIAAFVRDQYSGENDDYIIAAELTQLIQDGKCELYDDGESFI